MNREKITSGRHELSLYNFEGSFDDAMKYINEVKEGLLTDYPNHQIEFEYDYGDYSDNKTLFMLAVRLETDEEVAVREERIKKWEEKEKQQFLKLAKKYNVKGISG